MKKNILIIGCAGCGNKGDDAILNGIILQLKDRYNIYVVHGHYGCMGQVWNEIAGKYELRLCEGISLPVVFNVLHFLIKYIVLLRKMDKVFIGGGSLLHDTTSFNLPYFFLLQNIAKLAGKEVVWIGVGAGTIKTKKGTEACKKNLYKAERIILRDLPDYKIVNELGGKAVLSGDLAFSYKLKEPEDLVFFTRNHLKEKEYIVVTARQWFSSENFWDRNNMNFSKEISKLADLIIHLHDLTDKRIVFLPTVFYDTELGKELKKVINEDWLCVLDDLYSFEEMEYIISKSYMLFGMRMHSIIFAIKSGVPFLCMIYHEKVISLLNRCSMSEYGMDFNDIDSLYIDNKVEDIRINYDIISSKLLTFSDEMYTLTQNCLRDV